MTTHYLQFEDAGTPREVRLADAADVLVRLAMFYMEDGYGDTEFTDACLRAWKDVDEDA